MRELNNSEVCKISGGNPYLITLAGAVTYDYAVKPTIEYFRQQQWRNTNNHLTPQQINRVTQIHTIR